MTNQVKSIFIYVAKTKISKETKYQDDQDQDGFQGNVFKVMHNGK